MSQPNIAAIARWAGISRATMYQWRRSRPVLYAAIIEKARREGVGEDKTE